MYKLLLFLLIHFTLQAAKIDPLIIKLNQYELNLEHFEACMASFLRQESKMNKCLELNDRLTLSLESLLNHRGKETLTFQKEIYYRNKKGNYLALTIIEKGVNRDIDIFLPSLKSLADRNSSLDSLSRSAISKGLSAPLLMPKAFIALKRFNNEKSLFSNTYQTSRFSQGIILSIPTYTNYFNSERIFATLGRAYRISTTLNGENVSSKNEILTKLNSIEKRLGEVYTLANNLQPLANYFALQARKAAKAKQITHGQKWTINGQRLKFIDDDQRALFTYIDKNKANLIDAFSASLKNMEKWLIRNDLHELLGEGLWMTKGASDLAQTSNYAQFQEAYHKILVAQKNILTHVAKEQQGLAKRAFRFQSDHQSLWQELYQLKEALKEATPKEIAAPMEQFSDNLKLIMTLASKE